MLKLIVDRNHFTGMQTQIASQIAALIRSGALSPGEVLPGESKLAEQYGISRNVVREAYQILKNKKLIKSSRQRKETVVCAPVEGVVSFEYLRVRLPSEFKERIDVVSLMKNMAPEQLLELELRRKINRLFDRYRARHQKSSVHKSRPDSLTNKKEEG